MELITKIQVDNLTEKSVSILTQTFSNIDGVECQVGNNHRTGYINSTNGRVKLANNVIDPYYSTVIAVWGDAPTVDDSIIIEDDYKGDIPSIDNNSDVMSNAVPTCDVTFKPGNAFRLNASPNVEPLTALIELEV